MLTFLKHNPPKPTKIGILKSQHRVSTNPFYTHTSIQENINIKTKRNVDFYTTNVI